MRTSILLFVVVCARLTGFLIPGIADRIPGLLGAFHFRSQQNGPSIPNFFTEKNHDLTVSAALDERSVTEWLLTHGIPVDEWGKGCAKRPADLVSSLEKENVELMSCSTMC